MKKAIPFIIYFAGVFASYEAFKFDIVHQDNDSTHVWSKQDRAVALAISVGSWVSLLAAGIVYIIQSSDGSDPASW